MIETASSGTLTIRRTSRLLALLAFFVSLVIYSLTLAPTTSFWDPGEFIAVAHGLQVNHPPGAPFYSLVGRMFSMFMPDDLVAASVNFVSALSSALTVMLLFLIVVRLVEEFKGRLESMGSYDRFATLSGALVGSLTFAFTDTFWFNAVEAEVYAPSMFFTAIVVWIALKWAEEHEQADSDRWLLLTAYMFGLALGVHLLNLLALFFVALIVYFKRRDFSIPSFAAMAGIAVGAFLLIYPITMFNLTDLIDDIGAYTFGLIGPTLYLMLIAGAVAWGIWHTQRKGHRLANLAMLSYAMILIGFSTYSLIFIRAQADTPINENDPSTPEAIVSYLKREQYGETPLLTGYSYNNAIGDIDRRTEVLFPRRHSGQPHHLEYYSGYDSDLQYFLGYQLNHMYWRYFAWNFIGRDSDVQDAAWTSGFRDTRNEDNPAHAEYFFLPLLFGMIGLVYHFRSDPKRAFSVLALFFLTGLAIILYLNQSPYEPRERDYAYVGSFFAFSAWIGLGMTGLLDAMRGLFRGKWVPAAGVTVLSLAALPLWMGAQNWESHDRSGNYVARDYAWNLLQSLEPNAIVFTNGDNDTFPLWYAQEVEGVRTDVRVVCLSLLNTDWYIKQMRDLFSHESRPLPIGMNDRQVEEVTSSLSLHQPRTLTLPVDKDLLRRAFDPDGAPAEWTGVNTSTANFEHQVASAIPYSLPVDSLDDQVSWFLQGRFAGQDGQGNERYYLQTQDVLILEILRNNQWLRPVYFANTVSRDSQLGLQDFFQYEGKAYRVVPKSRPAGNFGTLVPEVHEARLEAFRFEQWNDPEVYFDENIRRMMGNYRFAFTELADEYLRRGNSDKALHWLRTGLEKIPFRPEEKDELTMSLYAYRMARAGGAERAADLAQQTQQQILRQLAYDLEDLDALETEAQQLRVEAALAREDGDLAKSRRLNERSENLQRSASGRYRDLSFTNSMLTIVQRVHYLTQPDEEDRAGALAEELAQLTEGRFQLPGSEEESRRTVDAFNLGIGP